VGGHYLAAFRYITASSVRRASGYTFSICTFPAFATAAIVVCYGASIRYAPQRPYTSRPRTRYPDIPKNSTTRKHTSGTT
jgi:hypothetical protein